MKINKSGFLCQLLVAVVISCTFCCAPKEQVVFKGVKNITVDLSEDGKPVLKADVFFFNPNKAQAKLKRVDVIILVDSTKSAEVDQKFNLLIPGQSDFSVPITAKLTLKEGGLLNAVLGLLGGRKYDVVFTGFIRISVHGFSVKVPVSQRQEIKLR